MYTKNEIRERITSDYRWMTRAVVAIYNYQTESEQQTDSTHDNNGVGFNGCDAEFLSSLAKQIKSGKKLSERQQEFAYKKIAKYAGQLYLIQKGERK
jgi:hypothetical protein